MGLAHIELIIIPIEQGFSGIVQSVEEFTLNLIEHIEAYENVGVVRKCISVELLYGISVQHPFVGDALLHQSLAEALIDMAEGVPNGDELFLQGGTFLDGEIVEELLDGFFLFLVDEGVVVHQGTQVLQVGKEVMGIDHILVGIIEVGQQQFSPEIEVIQGFLALCLFAEYLI